MNKIAIMILGLALGVSAVGAYALEGGLTGPAPSTASISISGQTTVTETLGGQGNITPGCVLAKSVASHGYSIDLYLPSSPKISGNNCMDLILRNTGTESPNVQGIIQQVNITDASGRLVSTWSPIVLASGVVPPGGAIHGAEYWTFNDVSPSTAPQTGIYHVHVDIRIPQTGASAAVELASDADLTLTN